MPEPSRDTAAADAPYGVRPTGYRLPAGTRVGRVRLQVADLARSLDYYETVLGLRVLSRDGGEARLGPHDDDTALVELHEHPGAQPVPRRGRLGLFHYAVLLPDRAALGRFVAHLTRLGVRAGMSDHLVSEAVYLYDPDGLGIEVYADRPRETWRHRDRELLMDTLPLDVHAVMAAAEGVPWTGMPAGTTMGHVHLHVGDLDEARRFYHEGLGLDLMVWSYGGALFFAAGGYHHHLGTNTWAAGAEPAGADDARLLEWELILPGKPDVHGAVGSLLHHRYQTELAGGSTGLVVDPWGTWVRLRPAT